MELTLSDIKDALNLTRDEVEQLLTSLKENTPKVLVMDNVYTQKCVLPIGNIIINGSFIWLGYLIIDDQVCNKFILSEYLPKANTTYNVSKGIIDGVEAITNTHLLNMLNITLKAV